ncbi:MAG: anthranilate synthase component I family protein [Bermanella sp.]
MKLEITNLPYLRNTSTLLERLQVKGGLVALESSSLNHENGRWSIISAAPVSELTYFCNTQIEEIQIQIERLLRTLPNSNEDLPFIGGIIGHASYDLGLVDNPSIQGGQPDIPRLLAGLYSWAFLIDHLEQKTILVYWTEISETPQSELEEIFRNSLQNEEQRDSFELTSDFQANWEPSTYKEKIESIHNYIKAGDSYQVNLAQSFTGQYKGNPLIAYEKLKQFAEIPFACFFEHTNFSFASASPELFLSCTSKEIVTKPIKGTLPRDPDPIKDNQNKIALKNSEKDRAENLMIVDLLRNDLSKNAYNVKTPALFDVESFTTVHHLVSTVTATLNPGTSPLKLFFDAFPGGSITGAPKKRSMEIISELEDKQRSFYCGSSFYQSTNGNFNSNILIRSFLFHEGEVTCWAGGGIVDDSEWQSEYQESLDKVSKLITCISN